MACKTASDFSIRKKQPNRALYGIFSVAPRDTELPVLELSQAYCNVAIEQAGTPHTEALYLHIMPLAAGQRGDETAWRCRKTLCSPSLLN